MQSLLLSWGFVKVTFSTFWSQIENNFALGGWGIVQNYFQLHHRSWPKIFFQESSSSCKGFLISDWKQFCTGGWGIVQNCFQFFLKLSGYPSPIVFSRSIQRHSQSLLLSWGFASLAESAIWSASVMHWLRGLQYL